MIIHQKINEYLDTVMDKFVDVESKKMYLSFINQNINEKLFRVTNKKEKHYDFQCHDGLNELVGKFESDPKNRVVNVTRWVMVIT